MAASKAPKKRTTPAPKMSVWRGPTVRMLRSNVHMAAFAFIFAGLGAYLLSQSYAARPEELPVSTSGISTAARQPEKTGPCAGIFKSHRSATGAAHANACYHHDPGPAGVEARERAKNIDLELAAQVAYDKAHPPPSPDAAPQSPPLKETSSNLGRAGSLGAVNPVNWPCYGTGQDGYRVRMIYVYPAGGTNRRNSLRPAFESIARRLNAVSYYSGIESGQRRMVRFATDSNCVLSISQRSITGDINNFDNVTDQLYNSGFTAKSRKYLVMVDGGTQCGAGDKWNDSRPSAALNRNNGGEGAGPSFAVTWKPCWNYAEPHELMHTFGGVQKDAPYATLYGHCTDQNDVMCYADGDGKAMRAICTSSTAIWRFDCNRNSYFDAYGATGYLSTHWNTANSYWYTR